MSMRYNKTKPVIWIIDREQWPRANLRALLLDRGFDAIGFEEIGAALAALKDIHQPKPCIIILELRALSPSEEELNTLARLSIPIVGLAGALELSQPWVKGFNWAALIQRPVTIGRIADTVGELVRSESRDDPKR